MHRLEAQGGDSEAFRSACWSGLADPGRHQWRGPTMVRVGAASWHGECNRTLILPRFKLVDVGHSRLTRFG